jgi:Spy/CpxP family protein refolding chaperone
MRKPLLAFVVLTFLASALLLAQTIANPPGTPSPAMLVQHRVKYLTTVLSLTTEQQQQATTLFSNAAGADEAVHKNMRAAHQDLQAAVKANDAAGIDQAANAIGGLSAQLISAQAKADAAFYQLLSAEQQTKLSQLQAAGGGPDHFFVMGGPFVGGMGVVTHP